MYAIFNYVLYISFIGTIAVFVISFVKYMTKSILGIKFQYTLDFILILRLLICFGITTNLSIYNYVPSYNTTIMSIPSIIETQNSVEKTPYIVEYIKNDLSNSTVNNNIMFNFITTARIIWILGIIAILMAMALSVIKTRRAVKKEYCIDDEYLLNIFEKCKRKTGVNRNIDLVSSKFIKSPSIYGFIHPKILIPELLLQYKDEIDFKYIFMHELVHAKKNHILINYIIFVLSTIHWFNPIIKYGLNKMKEDMEISCDLEVLYLLDENENENYGNSLLDLAEISVRAPWLPQMAGIINNKNKLKRRIEMIKKFKKNTYKKFSAIALAGVVIIGGAVLTEAKASNVMNGNTQQIIEDKLDYDFVNDEEVLGKWEAVDFVKTENDFEVGKKSWKDDLYLKNLIFLPDGKMAQPIVEDVQSDETTPVGWLTWTKGIVMHYGDKTASSYKIKEINGEKYMFYQWKSGDYIYRGQTPYYYVLKQVK